MIPGFDRGYSFGPLEYIVSRTVVKDTRSSGRKVVLLCESPKLQVVE